MAAAWCSGVSGVLLLLLPTVLAELRIAGAVEELDEGKTSRSVPCRLVCLTEAGMQAVLAS
jgi:hypothetical protein